MLEAFIRWWNGNDKAKLEKLARAAWVYGNSAHDEATESKKYLLTAQSEHSHFMRKNDPKSYTSIKRAKDNSVFMIKLARKECARVEDVVRELKEIQAKNKSNSRFTERNAIQQELDHAELHRVQAYSAVKEMMEIDNEVERLWRECNDRFLHSHVTRNGLAVQHRTLSHGDRG